MSDINNLMFEAFKEQKYNELLKENQKLKIEISARETVCDELQERINKAVEYIEDKLKIYPEGLVGKHLGQEFLKDILDLLKGDKE